MLDELREIPRTAEVVTLVSNLRNWARTQSINTSQDKTALHVYEELQQILDEHFPEPATPIKQLYRHLQHGLARGHGWFGLAVQIEGQPFPAYIVHPKTNFEIKWAYLSSVYGGYNLSMKTNSAIRIAAYGTSEQPEHLVGVLAALWDERHHGDPSPIDTGRVYARLTQPEGRNKHV